MRVGWYAPAFEVLLCRCQGEPRFWALQQVRR